MASFCPACRNHTISGLTPIHGQRYATCASCRSIYLDVPRDEARSDGLAGGSGRWRPGPVLGEHQRRQIAGLLARLGHASGSILVVEKSGRRAMVGLAEAAAGAEGLKKAAFEGKETKLLDLPGAVGKMVSAGGRPAGAVVAGTLERLTDPDPLLQAIAGGLEPGGLLCLVIPNAAFARMVLGMRRRNSAQLDEALGQVLDPGSRKLLCSVSGLRAMLARNGLDMQRVRAAVPTPLAGRGSLFQAAAHTAFTCLQLLRPQLVLSHYIVCLARTEG